MIEDPRFALPPPIETRSGDLIERYVVPPFSVLDTRQGYWQDRKRFWLALGIQSELGRGEGAIQNYRVAGVTTRGNPEAQRHLTEAALGPARAFGQDLMRGEGRREADARSNVTGAPALPGWATNGTENMAPGTSIFDPVLCELMYRWFCPAGGSILDPFAGGSVRGIVAAMLGHQYTGIDLSSTQIAANEAQAAQIVPPGLPMPRWISGDSHEVLPSLPQASFDMVFSCPPYYDLEVYSDDPRDLSAMPTYGSFAIRFREIIERAALCLRRDRFAAFVVSEVRGGQGGGADAGYVGLVPDTIRAMSLAGMAYWNEAILINTTGSLALRIEKQFGTNRKLGRTHQNIVVGLKGSIERGWDYGRTGPPDPQMGMFGTEADK